MIEEVLEKPRGSGVGWWAVLITRGVMKVHSHTWPFFRLGWARKILHADATEMTRPLPSIKVIYSWLWSHPTILATQ